MKHKIGDRVVYTRFIPQQDGDHSGTSIKDLLHKTKDVKLIVGGFDHGEFYNINICVYDNNDDKLDDFNFNTDELVSYTSYINNFLNNFK